jgi:hypothetical protein
MLKIIDTGRSWCSFVDYGLSCCVVCCCLTRYTYTVMYVLFYFGKLY